MACFLLSLIALQAQKREEGYDFKFQPTTNEPRYHVVTEKKDTLWHRQAWYMPEQKLAMEAWYKDSLAKMLHGREDWYYSNGRLKTSGSYFNGKKEGAFLEYNKEGRLTGSTFYVNGWRKGLSLSYGDKGHIDTILFDGAGNGVMTRRNKDGNVSATGSWIADTLRHGRWFHYYADGKVESIEEFVNGKRIDCMCYNEDGQQLDSATCVEQEATFLGGERAWRQFLAENLQPLVPVRKKAPLGVYTVAIQFLIEKDGSVSQITPLTKFGYGMEEEVIRVLKKAPRWTPALQNGKKVKAYRLQPVTFTVSI